MSAVQTAIVDLRTATDPSRVSQVLSTIAKATQITDVEWLYEVFMTGTAKTAEEAQKLFELELEENYKPFI